MRGIIIKGKFGRRSALFLGLSLVIPTVVAQSEFPFPKNWAQPLTESGQHCYSLSGTYRYLGERTLYIKTGPDRPLFDGTVFARIPPRGGNPTATQVTHDVEGGVLHIKIIGENLTPPDRTSFSEKVSCVGGWTTLEQHDSGYADSVSIKLNSTEMFTKGADGSIIVRYIYQEERRTFFFFVSHKSGEEWFRFLPVADLE